MICKKPYWKGALPYGCGQCTPCRVNKKRLWIHRLVLENFKHGDASFITLTYDDANLPEGNSLVPAHSRDFIKRVRAGFDQPLRYFLVGEYGNEGTRGFNPHYHLLLFRYPTCCNGGSLYDFNRIRDCCVPCDFIRDKWKKGAVHLGTVNKDSIDYCAGYVTKKMTRSSNDYQKKYLDGRYPEFARMSLKPGIGALALDDIAEVFKSDVGYKLLEKK